MGCGNSKIDGSPQTDPDQGTKTEEDKEGENNEETEKESENVVENGENSEKVNGDTQIVDVEGGGLTPLHKAPLPPIKSQTTQNEDEEAAEDTEDAFPRPKTSITRSPRRLPKLPGNPSTILPVQLEDEEEKLEEEIVNDDMGEDAEAEEEILVATQTVDQGTAITPTIPPVDQAVEVNGEVESENVNGEVQEDLKFVTLKVRNDPSEEEGNDNNDDDDVVSRPASTKSEARAASRASKLSVNPAASAPPPPTQRSLNGSRLSVRSTHSKAGSKAGSLAASPARSIHSLALQEDHKSSKSSRKSSAVSKKSVNGVEEKPVEPEPSTEDKAEEDASPETEEPGNDQVEEESGEPEEQEENGGPEPEENAEPDPEEKNGEPEESAEPMEQPVSEIPMTLAENSRVSSAAVPQVA